MARSFTWKTDSGKLFQLFFDWKFDISKCFSHKKNHIIFIDLIKKTDQKTNFTNFECCKSIVTWWFFTELNQRHQPAPPIFTGFVTTPNHLPNHHRTPCVAWPPMLGSHAVAQSCRKRCSTGQRASEPTGPIVLGSGVWIWRVFFLSYFLKIVMKYMFFFFWVSCLDVLVFKYLWVCFERFVWKFHIGKLEKMRPFLTNIVEMGLQSLPRKRGKYQWSKNDYKTNTYGSFWMLQRPLLGHIHMKNFFF